MKFGALVVICLAVSAHAQPKLEGRPPFLGETLRFAMSVLGASAGELTLTAKETSLNNAKLKLFIPGPRTVASDRLSLPRVNDAGTV